MREKAMREVILAQLGALRADAGVELVACKDECVGDYLTGKADALAVAMQMVAVEGADRNHGEFFAGGSIPQYEYGGERQVVCKGHDGADLRGQSRWVHGSLQSGYRNQGGEQI